MANRGSELVRPLVRPRVFTGTLAEVEKQLDHARRSGLLQGEQYTVARLKDGRYAVKVWMVGHYDPIKPARWPLTPGQTLALTCALGALAFLAVVLWLIVQAVTAVGNAIERNAGPIVGALIVLGLITLLIGRGGRGGTFSGTFKGTWR